jgi:hypothetical protein
MVLSGLGIGPIQFRLILVGKGHDKPVPWARRTRSATVGRRTLRLWIICRSLSPLAYWRCNTSLL